jgi:hypothetical protein
MVRQEAEATELPRILRFQLGKPDACRENRFILGPPRRLVVAACLDLVPGEPAVSVLEQDILMVFTEYLFNVLSVVKKHTAHDRRPRPLIAIAIGGLIARVAARDCVLGARDWSSRHLSSPRNRSAIALSHRLLL